MSVAPPQRLRSTQSAAPQPLFESTQKWVENTADKHSADKKRADNESEATSIIENDDDEDNNEDDDDSIKNNDDDIHNHTKHTVGNAARPAIQFVSLFLFSSPLFFSLFYYCHFVVCLYIYSLFLFFYISLLFHSLCVAR